MQKNALMVMLAAMGAAFCSGTAYGQNEQEFMKGDSAFVAAETHAATPVTAGERAGWMETKDTVRFGRYSLVVTRRLDPATNLPSPQLHWDDSFVGILGKQVAFYMQSGWSRWNFLLAAIHLEGDEQPLPDPVLLGKLVFTGLRESTEQRIVADAVWQDSAGGLLRARFVGWRESDRFGLALKYTPPKGRKVAELKYELACQPYDFSDHGNWERRRWLATPNGDAEVVKEPKAFTATTDNLFVFYNRLAQNTAGTFLAVAPDRVACVSATLEGPPIKLQITPQAVDREVVMVLGDWVDNPYALEVAGFLAQRETVAQELQQTVAQLKDTPPAKPDPAADAEIDRLLKRYPVLTKEFGGRLKEVRQELAGAWRLMTAGGGQADLPTEALVTFQRASSAQAALYCEIRAQWVLKKLFAETPSPTTP